MFKVIAITALVGLLLSVTCSDCDVHNVDEVKGEVLAWEEIPLGANVNTFQISAADLVGVDRQEGKAEIKCQDQSRLNVPDLGKK